MRVLKGNTRNLDYKFISQRHQSLQIKFGNPSPSPQVCFNASLSACEDTLNGLWDEGMRVPLLPPSFAS